MQSISLSELTSRIHDVIHLNFKEPVWVRAEISELHENSAGHCYMELVEKSENSDVFIAKIRANCWASTYRMLKTYFESETGQVFTAGIAVLIAVNVEYHPNYGLSLTVRDIDPVFTVGEIAVRRMKIVQQLTDEGIVDMNKQLKFPSLPQRIAIISSETAAGYGDFSHQLQNNSYHYAFYPVLFPAIMQGDAAVKSIIKALEKIYESIEYFDVVVMIRGGGATTDLACFDSYELALHCAQFPLPILSGIGHQRDNSILDIVAHYSLKTPTATASYLIDSLRNEENALDAIITNIADIAFAKIEDEKQQLQNKVWTIRQLLKSKSESKRFEITQIQNRLKSSVQNCIMYQHTKINNLEKMIHSHSPENVLKRGYSITTLNKKRIVSKFDVKQGDTVITILSDGEFSSKVLE